mgnify:FL=1
MTRIVWDGYIQEQMHWAECLSKIALEAENGAAASLRAHADRAFINAGIATARMAAFAAMTAKSAVKRH